ncbi:MAG: (2Fe-2S)-binding protein [Phycisphaerales bacterium]|jgi:NAD(P)H-nitrite reductase large subunit|nr:(2Fe-2S)-binding protein [Phycisphaerales bacterium]
MQNDDEVCLCFHVSQRKLIAYLRRTKPRVASQLAQCLDAGTGCGWCRPFLNKLHQQWQQGEPMGLTVGRASYAEGRDRHRAKSEDRDQG